MTTNAEKNAISVRRVLRATDRSSIERLLTATGFFNPEEPEIAMELFDDRLIQD